MTNWGIIGAGGIARVFANGVRFSRTGRVVAIASRTPGRGKSLAEDFSIPRLFGSYEELLADKEVDAVYVSLIHPHHAEWAIKAARAGKHVLVEKPLAMNCSPSRPDRRRGAAERRVSHGSIHVPLSPADGAHGRADTRGGHRRGARHPRDVQLLHAR